MPSKKYNLVQNPGDDLDSRIPLVPDEAFQHGINFNVKFIGAMDIPRPTSRIEIVAAMRRVRFEFKSKGIKKRKVSLTVSTEGIRTSIRKKTKGRKKQQLNVPEIIVESHPIYRIFYVSHDSQDVKIFSYIARETSSSVFHCVVFKASNKNQAMKIVRTVGQAFEVCHKVSGPYESSDIENQESSNKERESSHVDDSTKSKKLFESKLKPGNSPQKKIPPPIHVINQVDDREYDKEELIESQKQQLPNTPILKEYSNVHEIKLLREKYEQATQATNAALAQVSLLRDQLQAESNARIEAQTRTHQLLQHNKELLDHLQSLVHHIQELEGNARQSSSSCSISPTPLPQLTTHAKVERWFEYPESIAHPESSGFHGSNSFFGSLWDKINFIKLKKHSNISL